MEATEMSATEVVAKDRDRASKERLWLNRSTKVAILTGGGDRPYALGLAEALLSQGIGLDFIGSDELRCQELESDAACSFLNLRGDQDPQAPIGKKLWRVAAYYLKLLGYAARTKTRLFHILWNNKFESFDRSLLLLYYKLLGKSLILTAHNVNTKERDSSDDWWNRWTLRLQYRLVDHIFVHTNRMKCQLVSDFSVSETKVTVIPFGMNATIPDTSLTSERAREVLKLKEADQVLLFFGNIAPYKGLDLLVTAFLNMAAEGENYRLIIAGRPKGSSAYWDEISARLSRSDVEDRVLQRIEYIPDSETELYFKAADVLILPYKHIFQSGVLFLGYNFGLPAIVADVGSLRDEIVDGETGFVFRSMDAADLEARIRDYFASDLYRELPARRERIREYASERYSWRKVAATTVQVYEDLLFR